MAGPARRMGPRSALVVLAFASALAASGFACRESAPPPYLRLSGPAPDFPSGQNGASGQGRPKAPLESRRPSGSAQLVVFWASWCAPCREETPQLSALAAAPPEPLSVLVFSHDSSLATVRDFFGGTIPPALNLQLDPGERLAGSFGVDALPASFLVVEGQLVARFAGPRDWNSAPMRGLLLRLMKERLAPDIRHRAPTPNATGTAR